MPIPMLRDESIVNLPGSAIIAWEQVKQCNCEIEQLRLENEHLNKIIDGLVKEKTKERVLDTEVKLELIKWFRDWRKYRRELEATII